MKTQKQRAPAAKPYERPNPKDGKKVIKKKKKKILSSKKNLAILA